MIKHKSTQKIWGELKELSELLVESLLGFMLMVADEVAPMGKRRRLQLSITRFILISLLTTLVVFLVIGLLSSGDSIVQDLFINLCTTILGNILVFWIVSIYWDSTRQERLHIVIVILFFSVTGITTLSAGFLVRGHFYQGFLTSIGADLLGSGVMFWLLSLLWTRHVKQLEDEEGIIYARAKDRCGRLAYLASLVSNRIKTLEKHVDDEDASPDLEKALEFVGDEIKELLEISETLRNMTGSLQKVSTTRIE